jgi:hypothetical protein
MSLRELAGVFERVFGVEFDLAFSLAVLLRGGWELGLPNATALFLEIPPGSDMVSSATSSADEENRP